jgi:hypothetical protein
MSDAVMAMMSMPTPIAVEVVSHMDQLFGNDDLNSPGKRLIDPAQVDEHRVKSATADEAVRPAVAGWHQSANPLSVYLTAGRHSQGSIWKRQAIHVAQHKRTDYFVTFLEIWPGYHQYRT